MWSLHQYLIINITADVLTANMGPAGATERDLTRDAHHESVCLPLLYVMCVNVCVLFLSVL